MTNIVNKIGYIKNQLLDGCLPALFCKSRFLSSLYYFLFSSAFSREHQAVLSGKARHLRETNKEKANYFLLVRNTHRIEKGLLMSPRQALFATSYVGETVDNFGNIWNRETCEDNSNPQQKWFKDVMTEYFDAVINTPFILEQRKKFKAIVNGQVCHSEGTKFIPYCRETANYSNMNFDEFYKLARQRRSVRWYLPKAVPREAIDKAILAANQSPSACNRQPFEFKVFDEPDLVNELVGLPMGTKGYAHSIPVFVIIVGNLGAYVSERDRHVIYIDGALAGMAFMLALETLGLSSCPINWPDIEKREERMKDFLGLDTWQRPVMCLGLGYPDPEGKVAFSAKRSLDQIRNYNAK